jgi:putative nucleotidyltransferase with HDIG domain
MMMTLENLIAAARQAEQAGEWTEAANLYNEAIARIEAGEQPERAPQVIRWLGRVYFERGDYDQANATFENSLIAAQRLNQRQDAASALNWLAAVAQFRGRLDVAEVLYQRAAALAADLGDDQLCAMIDQNLGTLANIRGDLGTALLRYQGALERFRAAKDDQACAKTLNNMGMLHVDVGEWTAAELCFKSAIEVSERIGDQNLTGRLECNRADLYIKRQQFERARESCERAFKIFTRLESDSGLGSVHKFYGAFYRDTGKSQLAHMHFSLALKLARTRTSPLLEADTESERARLFLNERQHHQALRSLNRAHRLYVELDARREILDLRRRLDRMQDVYVQALEMWTADAAEGHGSSSRGQRVAEYAIKLAEAAGYDALEWLRIGAYLHDVGNSGLPRDVLNKPGPLSADEWDLIRQHTTIGSSIVSDLEFPNELRVMVRNHHEHWDGSGYPDRLAGEQIPVAARILCIADIFDALISERSFRPAFSVEQALEIMSSEAGRLIDPNLFATFRTVVPSRTPSVWERKDEFKVAV